jgi:hypothetical protein
LKSKSRPYCKEEDDVFKAISYKNILAAFMILPIGLPTAFATLGLEKIKRRQD